MFQQRVQDIDDEHGRRTLNIDDNYWRHTVLCSCSCVVVEWCRIRPACSCKPSVITL